MAVADQGASSERVVRLAVDEVATSPTGRSLPEIELVTAVGEGHPRGTPDAVMLALRELATAGVLVVIGPAISDNALACLPVAGELQLPCINYTGSELTRSEWMFHYQVGSLEDEPFVLARRLAEQGLRRVALVREDSFIGRQYASFFDDAVAIAGLELLGTVDLDVGDDEGARVVDALARLDPDAVVYFGLGLSARGLSTALRGRAWPVATNSALMFGHLNPDRTADFEGWTYVDAFDEDNPVRQALQERIGLAVDQPGPAADVRHGAARRVGHPPRAGAVAHGCARRPRAGEATARGARDARYRYGLRPVEARRARGRLPRAAPVAGRAVGEAHPMKLAGDRGA